MYNSVTQEKIKGIPQIGDIDIDRLPQELSRIYAQIISLRRQFNDGTLDFQIGELEKSFQKLQTLSSNLETILILNPNHERKESISFVAGIAQSLIYKMFLALDNSKKEILEIDTISPIISASLLFLIGNSQADAAEISDKLYEVESTSPTRKLLVSYVKALAKGNLAFITNNLLKEEDILTTNLQEAALDYLWRELGLGIFNIALKLLGKQNDSNENNHFDKVIELSVAEEIFENQKSVFAGPYHLAKLLKILENDIFNRGVINITPPSGIDPFLWTSFLEKLALNRPYLWENHTQVINSNFLEIGTSAVLTLPTGAGKSTLSELKIASSLFADKIIIYLVPTHALEDQINNNLKALFEEFAPDTIAFDGEFTDLEDVNTFPIFVMTPERCLTLLNINPEFFETVGLVVFDEFHLIHGSSESRDRRAVDAMYCLISLFTIKPKADYLLISAMVENGNEIAEWLKSITGNNCILFNSSWKPTRQLHGCLIFEEAEIKALDEKIKLVRQKKSTVGPPVTLKRSATLTPYCFFSLKNIWETENEGDYYKSRILERQVLLGINKFWNLTTNRNEIAATLGVHYATLGIKTLIFVDNPTIAHSTSQKIIASLNGRTNSYSKFLKNNSNTVNSITLELGSFENSFFHNHDNVGVHHGLLLPIERGIIEDYFKDQSGSIVLVATATLAQGINLPAEVVIIAGDDRFEDGARERIPPHELLNAAGRAGRAGQSSQGAVILIPGEIVTINESTISNRWWSLKKEVFSKSDQCLTVKDPLEYFLDSIYDESVALDYNQTNILYKFKSEKLSETETKELFNNSFYAFKAKKQNRIELFSDQVENLIRRRNHLDSLTEDITWIKEISFKTGIDPSVILLINHFVDQEDFEEFINFSVVNFINWLFNILSNNKLYLDKIFTKSSTVHQINKAIGLRPDNSDFNLISENLDKLREVLILFVTGEPLITINQKILGREDTCLTKARNFVIRLVPELSFSFGLIYMVVQEKAKQQGREKADLPWTIRALASCVREGFDEVEKLFFKRNKKLLTRVETHILYRASKTDF